jgi:hypothetical protein
MPNTYYRSIGRVPCSPRGGIARALLIVGLMVHAAMLSACREPDRVTGLTREDTELVGLWWGPMVGPWGNSMMSLRLFADSTMTVDNENKGYRHLDGTWTVSENRFVATGTPGDGVIVTLIAKAPFVNLEGTWTSNGASGTFNLSKR